MTFKEFSHFINRHRIFHNILFLSVGSIIISSLSFLIFCNLCLLFLINLAKELTNVIDLKNQPFV